MSQASVLQPCRLDLAVAETQLEGFKFWLDAHPTFVEREVVAELRARLHLCLLIYAALGHGGSPDRYKHEFDLQGAFRVDFVVGSTIRAHFVLVEFEGGEHGSIFSTKRGTAQYRDWGSPLQHAFSQVSDWSWAKNDNQKSDIYRNAFGGLAHMSETYLIVCGRDAFLNPIERSRLHWRSTKTMIASCSIMFCTYDGLYKLTSSTLDLVRDQRQ